MKVEVKVPAVGESVTEAVVATILKPDGSTVAKEDELIELETDKVNQVIYAPEAGKLELTVTQDQTVKVGDVIGYIETDHQGEAVVAEDKTSESTEEPALQPAKVQEELKPANEDVTSVRESKEDFIASLSKEKKPAESQPEAQKAKEPISPPSQSHSPHQERKRMSGLRKTIAKRLVEVKNQTAMLTTFNEVDMTEVIALRTSEKDAFMKKHGVKLGFMSFFVKATVAALKKIPAVNAFIDGDEMVFNSLYDIGISVSTEKGLMVPVVRDCANKSFADIEKAIVSYAEKARAGTISIEDMKGGTFTITNGGTFGSLLSTPILNPPQSAILGMHNIVKRPVVVNDAIEIRPMMYLALSYDHRIIDGKEAVTFLVTLKDLLEEPSRLLLDP